MPDIIQQIREALAAGENADILHTLLPELLKAADKGKIVELPCKVGDAVYYFWTDDDNPEIKIDHIFEFCVDEIGLYISTDPYDGFLCYVSELGKKSKFERMVFLTREAAEKALKERET